MRAGVHFALAAFLLAISFGVVAQPIMGNVAPIVMSVVVYAGAAQFAALSVLAAGGGAGAAVVAGLLLNLRFIPMSLAAAPSFKGSRLRRVAEAETIVDASFALASRGDGTFDRGLLIGSSLSQTIGWWSGTAVGVFAGGALAHPEKLGLDAIFPAFYLALLFGEATDRLTVAVAIGGAAITLALMPIAPAGVPVVAAASVALVGLRR